MEREQFLERFVGDARRLGVRAGGVLLVHSSLSAFARPDGTEGGTGGGASTAARVPGGAQTIIAALIEAVGDAGTLVLPALSYERVTRHAPEFDARTTPSNVGVIAETFRLREDVIRSLHPTHSVCARGPRAVELTSDHLDDSTPCGPHSPFRLLPAAGGQILMLGCGLEPNTSMHAIEELVEPPYLFGRPYECVVTDATGRTTRKTYTPHGFDGWTQRYERVAQVLRAPALRAGTIAGATCHLIEASELWAAVEARLREDPLAFVEWTSEEADA